MTIFAEFRLMDPDLQTVHGILPFQKGDLYLQLNEPGSGSVKTALDIASAALVESAGFIETHYRDAVRGGFFVENLGESDVNAGEEAGRGLEISGRGALALLEDAVVWTDGSGANKRIYSGTQAAMLIELIEEAQTRGGLAIVDWDFTDTLDSDGVAWTDDFPLELTVGTSLLDVVRQIAKTGIDFEMTPDGSGNYVLSAYKDGIGSDKSETVYFRVGVNCTEVSHSEAGGGIRNALLVKYKNGYTSAQDATSITARRRREGVLNYDFVQRPDNAVTFANAELQGKKDPKRQISVKIYDGAGPRAFVDYILGDTITLDTRGTEEEYRIRGIHLSWVDNEHAEVIVDLNSMILENEIRVTQDVDWLLNEWKTAHDAGLLEVSFWAAIGNPNITYVVSDMLIVGDYLYVASTDGHLLIYSISAGTWTRVPLGYTPVCLEHLNGFIYLGCFHKVLKYEIATGTLTSVADVVYSDPLQESVFGIAILGNYVHCIGTFDSIGGVATTGNSMRYDTVGGTWTDTGSAAGKLLSDGTNLYSGATVWAGGTTWNALGTSPGTILCMAMFGTQILAGTSTGDHLYVWDGSTWATFGGGVSGTVRGLAVYLTDVYVVGSFTDEGNYIAKYSGGEWWALEDGLNAYASKVVLHQSHDNVDLYVGGTFTEADGKPALKLAAYFNNFAALTEYLETAGGESFNLGEAIHAATAKTPMVGADEMPLWDSITQRLRKITWTNILASIKTYTDGLYVALTGNQTVAGVKTFSSFPVTPSAAPTTDYEVANKKYVDDTSGGGGTPGGSDTEVQFNDGGVFEGDTEFTWNKTTKVLHLGPSDRGVRLLGADGDVDIYAPDSGNPAYILHSYNGVPAVISFVSEGTLASEQAVSLGKVLFQFASKAFNGTIYKDTGRIRAVATEDHDGTSGGMKWEFYCVSNTTNLETLVATFDQDGNINIASGKQYKVNGGQHTHDAGDIASGNIANARLGNTRFSLPFSSYATLASPISASPAFPYAATLPSFTIYPKQWSQGVVTGATNNGSNYWKLELLYTNAGVTTVAATVTTSALGTNTTAVLTTTSFDLSSYTQASHIRFAIRATKVGAPSDLNAHGPNVEYTLS